MPGSGTRTFLDPDHYAASLRQAQLELVITSRGSFRARVTWAELHNLQLLRCEEDFPRIGYVSLAPRLVFVGFPAPSGPLPVWGAGNCKRRTSCSTAGVSGCTSRRPGPRSGV